ncbi:MAG: Hcp family type VI secretion system effector [Rhodoferax sp.]
MTIIVDFGASIKGACKLEGYIDKLQVDSFQWGAGIGISAAGAANTTRTVSTPSISEVTLSRSSDKATPQLLKMLTKPVASPIGKVIISFTRNDAVAQNAKYMEFTLEDVFISGLSISSGGDTPSESLSLNFSKITVDYFVQGLEGTADGKESFIYDASKNVTT